jgi:hypothetical protein
MIFTLIKKENCRDHIHNEKKCHEFIDEQKEGRDCLCECNVCCGRFLERICHCHIHKEIVMTPFMKK